MWLSSRSEKSFPGLAIGSGFADSPFFGSSGGCGGEVGDWLGFVLSALVVLLSCNPIIQYFIVIVKGFTILVGEVAETRYDSTHFIQFHIVLKSDENRQKGRPSSFGAKLHTCLDTVSSLWYTGLKRGCDMPLLESQIIALFSSVASIFMQTIKNLIPERGRRWIPLGLLFVLTLLGLGLSMYMGRDPVAGVLEGFFGGAAALGYYEIASNTPGVNRVVNRKGWVGKRR